MASNLRALVADGEDSDLSGGGGDISIGSKGSAGTSPDLSGDGGDTTIKGGRSAQVWECDPADMFPVEWDSPFDLNSEGLAAGGNVRLLRAMANR